MTKTAQITTAAPGRREVTESGRQAPRRGKGPSLAAVKELVRINFSIRRTGTLARSSALGRGLGKN
jgi:hypothetical protein